MYIYFESICIFIVNLYMCMYFESLSIYMYFESIYILDLFAVEAVVQGEFIRNDVVGATELNPLHYYCYYYLITTIITTIITTSLPLRQWCRESS